VYRSTHFASPGSSIVVHGSVPRVALHFYPLFLDRTPVSSNPPLRPLAADR
jgi:hypothetical protein